MSTPRSASFVPARLRTARVLRVREQSCVVWRDGSATTVAFAPMFPSPRIERVSPGHLVALAAGPAAEEVVVWRWYDAVVIGAEDDGRVRLWEPAHGEVVADARPSHEPQEPGSRAWASAGLPGAEWWVADRVRDDLSDAGVELDGVLAVYSENDLWPGVFGAHS